MTAERARPPQWEARLAEQLRDAAIRPFHPSRWNCARFAHRCAEAVSLRTIPFRHCGSLESSADAVLPRIDPRAARRGDVVLADVPQPALGVCVGARAAFVMRDGLFALPMSRVRAAWSV